MSSLDEYSKAVRSVQNAKADKKEHPKGWEPGVVLNGGKSYVASGPVKSEKEARKNAKQLIKLLGEDLADFIEEVLEEPKIEDTLGFSNGLKGNQTYNDVAEKIATIK